MTPDCPSDEQFAALLEHRLDAAQAAHATAHIAGCAECQAVVEDHRHVFGSRARGTPASGVSIVDLEPGVALGRYVVVERIAAGAMGVLYSAYDSTLDRQVALKFLDTRNLVDDSSEAAVARLEREARALARLNHPNVVAVHDCGQLGDTACVAMELVIGGNLRGWLAAKPRSLEERLDVMLQAGEGLAAAHAAGLVHRDFKPENVLVGDDGRVRVTDFGLARTSTIVTAPPPDLEEAFTGPMLVEPADLERLTQTGALAGTPAYMAPEQYRGADVSVVADQFAFCVTLYEAVFGERPFAGETIDEISDAAAAGRVREASRRDVPGWLRRVVMRGLRPDPVERFESMTQLLAAIRRGRGLRRRVVIGASAVVVVVLAAAAGVAASPAPAAVEPIVTCDGAPDQLEGIWDRGTKERLRWAFLVTKVPFAEDAWTRVEPKLDELATGWSSAHKQACIETRIDHAQSEEVLARRSICLERSRQDLKALVEVFGKADAKLVTSSVQAVSSVRSATGCLDLAMLATPPPAPDVAPKVEALFASLSHVKAQVTGGQYPAAKQLVEPLIIDARRIGYGPLVAEALFYDARIEALLGDNGAARKLAYEAVEAADAAGQDVIAAQSWGLIVAMTDDDSAPNLQRAANGAIQRARTHALLDGSGITQLEAELSGAMAFWYYGQRNVEAALAANRRAWELQQQARGPDDFRGAIYLNRIATQLRELGRQDEALETARKALARSERQLGGVHPLTGRIMSELALVLCNTGHVDEGLSYFDRAQAVLERSLGATHHETIANAATKGEILAEIGRAKDALPAIEALVRTERETDEPNGPGITSALVMWSKALRSAGHADQALAVASEARDRIVKGRGPDHPDVLDALAQVGKARAALGDRKGALAAHQARLRLVERLPHPSSSLLLVVLHDLARAHLALGNETTAAALLERALTLGANESADAEQVAYVKMDLAEIRYSQPASRAHALALANESLVVLSKLGPRVEPARKYAENWLATRRSVAN
ncbi:MAG: protein kinase [Kofleriaceae bacterium]